MSTLFRKLDWCHQDLDKIERLKAYKPYFMPFYLIRF